jgi:membrane-associated phospholipid phosphatase
MPYKIPILASHTIFCKWEGILIVLLFLTNIGHAGDYSDTASNGLNKYLVTNKWVRKGIAPTFFLTSCALTWNRRVAVRDARNRYIPNFSNHMDDYMQYIPAAGVFALNLAGKKGLNHLSRAMMNWGTGMLIMGVMVNSVKHISKVMRPDNTSANSFPSGHTATAFMNASFLDKEFGYRNAAYGIVGYTMGTVTGIERSLNNRHWISDILAGAGIGILSTELAYMIVNRLYKNEGDYSSDYSNHTLYRTTENYSHIATHVGYSFYLNNKGFHPMGTRSAIEGFYYFSKNWGIGSEVIFTHYPLKKESRRTEIFNSENIQIKDPKINIQSAGIFDFMVGMEYARPLGSKFLLQIKAMTGLTASVRGQVGIEGIRKEQEKNVPISLSLFEYKPFPAPAYSLGVALTGMMTSNAGLSLFVDYKYSTSTFELKSLKQTSILRQQRYTKRISINSLTTGLRFTAFFG